MGFVAQIVTQETRVAYQNVSLGVNLLFLPLRGAYFHFLLPFTSEIKYFFVFKRWVIRNPLKQVVRHHFSLFGPLIATIGLVLVLIFICRGFFWGIFFPPQKCLFLVP